MTSKAALVPMSDKELVGLFSGVLRNVIVALDLEGGLHVAGSFAGWVRQLSPDPGQPRWIRYIFLDLPENKGQLKIDLSLIEKSYWAPAGYRVESTAT